MNLYPLWAQIYKKKPRQVRMQRIGVIRVSGITIGSRTAPGDTIQGDDTLMKVKKLRLNFTKGTEITITWNAGRGW